MPRTKTGNKKFLVHYERVISYDVAVTAENQDQAKDIAEDIINSADRENNENVYKQVGYIEYCYTDEEEEEE